MWPRFPDGRISFSGALRKSSKFGVAFGTSIRDVSTLMCPRPDGTIGNRSYVVIEFATARTFERYKLPVGKYSWFGSVKLETSTTFEGAFASSWGATKP